MHTKCQATRMYISREQKNLSPLMMPHRLCLFFSKSIGHNLTIHDTRIPILGCETASSSWMCYQKATSSNDANHWWSEASLAENQMTDARQSPSPGLIIMPWCFQRKSAKIEWRKYVIDVPETRMLPGILSWCSSSSSGVAARPRAPFGDDNSWKYTTKIPVCGIFLFVLLWATKCNGIASPLRCKRKRNSTANAR